MTPEETARRALETLGPDQRDTLLRAPLATIRPELESVQTGEHEALRQLAAIRERSEALVFGRTLGQGGMGLVREAEQRSVARPVAVKSLRPEIADERAAISLLQEGWVTGALEHPNVVPVHDMSVDDAGRPFIVLKRIAGRDWASLIADPEGVRDRFAVRDPLVWHLETLVQVCRAVEYAHSRGILHRDLKPENVRIGDYGEVYLLDWGIAVSLEDRGDGRLPLAREADHLAGTPAYMAPEMVKGEGALLGLRTDVYLLGAVLYELLYGAPPHHAPAPMAMLVKAAAGDVEFPSGPPAELVDLCRVALARDPSARPPSAEFIATGVRRYLSHRAAIGIAEQAAERLAQLETGETSGDADVYRLFGEARFGFRQALDAWPESVVAAEGQRRAIRWMVERELEAGRPEAARPLLEELDPPDPPLAARVEAAARAAAARRVELERIREEQDPRIGTRTRAFLALIFGVAWVGAPLAGWYPVPFPDALYTQLPLLLAALGLLYWARESMSRTQVNRRLAAFLVLALFHTILLQAAFHFAGVPWHTELHVLLFSWAALAAAFVIGVDRRLWLGAVAYYLGALVALVHPDPYGWTYAAASAVFIGNALWAWTPRDQPLMPGKKE